MQTSSRGITPEEREKLRSHVVNLRQGRFSTDGDFITTRQDVERLFAVDLPAALAEAKSANRKLRVLFYAHGGLVSEASGIAGALAQVDFWKANHVYPIFFIWETGILEVVADELRKQLLGQRGVQDFIKEAKAKLLESLARPGGLRVWNNMKLSAQAASAAGGGARVVIDLAEKFFEANANDAEVHACGHSAGAIFHSFFLPPLVKAGVPVASLSLLAPAVNIPTFKSALLPLAGKGIGTMTMLTMHREFERADTAGPYPKSLLYFVHHSFEDPDETPILGLEESLTADDAVMKLFSSASNEIVFSVTPAGASKRSSSRSIHHGDFDNDGPTMNSVCRRMLGVDDTTAIVEFPEGRSRAFDPLEQLNQELIAAATPVAATTAGRAAGREIGIGFGLANARGTAASVGAPHVAGVPAGGRRIALCIGIDAYPAPNTLHGCVNDSEVWEQLFASLQCQIATLRDAQATRAAMTDSLAEHVSRLRAGDLFLFQYAGHGVQFPDDSGDEPDNNDEALCPFDMMTAGFVRDDEVRMILNRVPAGALAIGFIDCCHSGTIARMVRALPDATAHSLIRAITATPAMIAVHRRTRKGGRAVTPALRRDITFAACRDDQVAFETNGHGDYTTAAVPIFSAHSHGLTNLQVQKLLQDAFGPNARQNPMLDCDPVLEDHIFLQP